ncbi:hypothetical protein [Psychroflexus sediminis]|uniref:DUF4129 domain-containing protein n=1 Tax=Psychroflexus sediminis TaxID=470826 RepID=A0A1G7XHV5_9FLAO|nr:hypothetical protein [Psychroflexus sediminis]SDG83687.1 hypothetical protein SAMN04488027_108120 [Psychroflexus sediminis]
MEVKSSPYYYSLALLFILNLIGTDSLWASPYFQSGDSIESRREVIEFDESLIEAYQADEAYNYFKNVREESAWEKFKHWLSLQWNRFLEWLLSGISEGNFWNYMALVLKILLILGLGLLIAWLFNKYYVVSQKSPPADQSELNLSEDERLIQQKDLSTLIEEAESEGNYRLASRYLFLNILKHLKDYNFIEYQFQKTNTDYKSEITQQDIRSDFSYASRFYEFVWYGDFKLGVTDFKAAKMRFENLIRNIHNSKTHG